MTSETFCIHMQLHPCIACATLSASLMSNEVRRSLVNRDRAANVALSRLFVDASRLNNWIVPR